MRTEPKFNLLPTKISDLFLIDRKPIVHELGFFERIFCIEEFNRSVTLKSIVQINRSRTKNCGSIRGLHYQTNPFAETKVITCIRGSVFDVAVDIRADSPTFLHWHGEILSESNNRSILIPEGFAHGFQTMDDDVEMLYLHTAHYSPNHEFGINPLDPRLTIDWPLPHTDISTRDQNHEYLGLNFKGIEL